MSKAKSIDDTNALNKPSQGYIAPVKPKPPTGEQISAPNYRKLGETQAKATASTLSSQAQYGQPAKETQRTPNGKVPMKVSNRPALVATNPATSAPTIQKPLALPKRPKISVSKAVSKTVGTPQGKKFQNKFDKPLTEREIAQLKLAQVQNKDQGSELLKKLLVQSQVLAKQLAPASSVTATAVVKPSPDTQRVLLKHQGKR